MSERNRIQNEKINFRVTKKAKELLILEAENKNISVAALIKSKVFGKAALRMKTSPAKPTKDLVVLRQILGELGKSGSNLNQLARHLNKGNESINPISLFKIQKELELMRDALVNELGTKK